MLVKKAHESHWASVLIGTAWFMWLDAAFHHGPLPL